MTNHIIKIQDVLKNDATMVNYDFPKWLVELCENHKSRWEPNSKGGEPNHD